MLSLGSHIFYREVNVKNGRYLNFEGLSASSGAVTVLTPVSCDDWPDDVGACDGRDDVWGRPVFVSRTGGSSASKWML